jgi:hypothetical protein
MRQRGRPLPYLMQKETKNMDKQMKTFKDMIEMAKKRNEESKQKMMEFLKTLQEQNNKSETNKNEE